MHRGNSVSFHFLAFYADGIDPTPGPDGPLRVGSTIQVEVDSDANLLQVVRDAVDADPVLGPRLSEFLAANTYRLLPLADGVMAADWSGSVADDPGSAQPIRWVINPDGTVRRVDLIRRPTSLSLRELDQLVELGYLTGDTRELLVFIDWWLGGGETADGLIQWLLAHGVDAGVRFSIELLLRYVLDLITGRARRSINSRRIRQVAALWDQNNFYRPGELREFVEVSDVWDAAELGRRLGLSTAAAVSLLRSLGYEAGPSRRWRQRTRCAAQRRRREWLSLDPPIGLRD